MLSALGIHEASSKPKPAAPRRSARPTLIKREFKVARPAPRKTASIPTYGLVVIDGRAGCAEGGSGDELVSTVLTAEALSFGLFNGLAVPVGAASTLARIGAAGCRNYSWWRTRKRTDFAEPLVVPKLKELVPSSQDPR